MSVIRRTRDESAANGISPNANALNGRSVIMYGILLPIRVRVLSLKAEKIGIKKMANILSRVIIVPIRAFDCIYLPKKIGIYVSYKGSISPIVKNPSPMRKVVR
jgi:hypothetical protein